MATYKKDISVFLILKFIIVILVEKLKYALIYYLYLHDINTKLMEY